MLGSLWTLSNQPTESLPAGDALGLPIKPQYFIPFVMARYFYFIIQHSIVAIFCQVTKGYLQGNQIKLYKERLLFNVQMPCKGAFANPFIIQAK